MSLTIPALASSNKDIGDFWIEKGKLLAYFGDDTEIVIPSSVTEIGSNAFQDIYTVKSIEIPNTVKTIDEQAFYECYAESITIPNSVTSIGAEAFAGSKLTSVVIPNSIKTINKGVFLDCAGLTTANIPASVKTIGDEAFAYCDLMTLIIPDGVQSIGKKAFEDNIHLKSIIISDSVTYIGASEDNANQSIEDENRSMDTNGAFYLCDDLIIYGSMSSYAFQYAQAHDIPFVDLSVTTESPDLATADPQNATVLVNNVKVLFSAYSINGYTYVKLRDVAKAVDKTEKNFNITWNSQENAIDITSGTEYSPIGGELAVNSWSGSVNAAKSSSNIYVDGRKESIDAYYINGSNYLKLRDIGSAVGIVVTYDSTINTISIYSDDTSMYDTIIGTWVESDDYYESTLSFTYGGIAVWYGFKGTYSIQYTAGNELYMFYGNIYFECTYEIKDENGEIVLYLTDYTGTRRFTKQVS